MLRGHVYYDKWTSILNRCWWRLYNLIVSWLKGCSTENFVVPNISLFLLCYHILLVLNSQTPSSWYMSIFVFYWYIIIYCELCGLNQHICTRRNLLKKKEKKKRNHIFSIDKTFRYAITGMSTQSLIELKSKCQPGL